jgi:hypothetical protein
MRALQMGDHDAGLSELRSEVDMIPGRWRATDCYKDDLSEALREEKRWTRLHT